MNRHQGMSDASCAIAVSRTGFLAADDERNVLCLYDACSSGSALREFSLDDLLGTQAGEVDLEGAASSGGVVYWISSHGRTAKGKLSGARYCFFASRITEAGGGIEVRRVGTPVTGLLDALLEEPSYRGMGLRKAAERAPKEEGGLNIEGLAADPEGGLLIGFRSPLVEGRALLAHLLNPEQTVNGSAPRFGPPRFLDLGGQGVRSLEYWAERRLLLAVAGGAGSGGSFRLHVFQEGQAPRVLPIPRDFSVEAVITLPMETAHILLLSDDGSVERSGTRAKKLPAGHPERYFRSAWMAV